MGALDRNSDPFNPGSDANRQWQDNPAEVLREIAVEAGHDVDHEALDKLADYYAQPGFGCQ